MEIEKNFRRLRLNIHICNNFEWISLSINQINRVNNII